MGRTLLAQLLGENSFIKEAKHSKLNSDLCEIMHAVKNSLELGKSLLFEVCGSYIHFLKLTFPLNFNSQNVSIVILNML